MLVKTKIYGLMRRLGTNGTYPNLKYTRKLMKAQFMLQFQMDQPAN